MADESDATARILSEALERRYPGRFTVEQVRELEKQIVQLRQAAEKLRTYRLTNADEPEPIFQACPRED